MNEKKGKVKSRNFATTNRNAEMIYHTQIKQSFHVNTERIRCVAIIHYKYLNVAKITTLLSFPPSQLP
jgi:hypothetical protein